MITSKDKIAIIGGGPTALAITREFINQNWHGEIHIWEPNTLGTGLVYGSSELQSSRQSFQSSKMVIFPDQPLAYLNWLNKNRQFVLEHDPHPFPSRQMMGLFLKDTVEQLFAQAEKKEIKIVHHKNKVDKIDRIENNFWKIEDLRFKSVFVCIGNLQPSAFSSFKNHDAYMHDVWGKSGFLQAAKGHDEICVIGSGLTSIDILLGLKDHGFCGSVVFASRNGFLPRIRGEEDFCFEIPAQWHKGSLSAFKLVKAIKTYMIEKCLEIDYPLALLQKQKASLNLLQYEYENVQKLGYNPLHALALGLEPYLEKIWKTWSEKEKQWFDKTWGSFWNSIHLPMIQTTAKTVIQSVAENCLSIKVLKNLTVLDKSLICADFEKDTQTFGLVINATGRGLDITKANVPLLDDLHKKEYIEPHPLGGVKLDDYNRVQPGLYVTGVLSRGEHFFVYVLKENGRKAQESVRHFLTQEQKF